MAAVEDLGGADTPRLTALAVERTYRAFAPHRLRGAMVVRRPDVSAADVAALGGPLREVPATAIDRWLPHATTTWGTGADLRALLPRVLELFAAGALSTPPEILFAKVHRAGAPDWTMEEQAAVEDVVTAVWLGTLTSAPVPGRPAWRLLVALAELGGDLGPFLDDWTLLLGTATPEGRAAHRHLLILAQRIDELAASGMDAGALFWSPRPREAQRLAAWLVAPAYRARPG